MAKIPASECKSPYFAYQKDGQWRIKRGSCNRWNCERCQHYVASQAYGRIVHGAEQLANEHEATLWFITVTCRGKELSVNDAINNYMDWTNHLLTLMRQHAAQTEQFWSYVQVTELQKRGHPHSHILTTFRPEDTHKGIQLLWERGKNPETGDWYKIDKVRSLWLHHAVIRSGLGSQYDISMVKEPRAASRYVAKYMFKDSQFETEYPDKWKRVRYSQNWPKLPEFETDALPLITLENWQTLATLAVSVSPDKESVNETLRMLRNTDVIVRLPKAD